MIQVWADTQVAGVLERSAGGGAVFACTPGAPRDRAVSLSMPMRVASYQHQRGLHPVFEMNLPEGALRERLQARFAKVTGTFDDMDLLAIVGRTQLGRLRYSGIGETLDDSVPFQGVDEILRARRDDKLFDYLLDQFARYSGVSGVQPKVLLRDQGGRASGVEALAPGFRAATHLVKLWEERDYPELAANEYHCLRVAQEVGLRVPRFQLSDDGSALVIDRFDLTASGYLGMEDFCVLNGYGTRQKYRGSYERQLVRRIVDFIPSAASRAEAMREVFRTLVLNTALRNGDAHLKNFALLYENPESEPRLTPVFDVVTTTAYLRDDKMALTMDGSTRWPLRKQLAAFGESTCKLGAVEVREIIEATVEAAARCWPEAKSYFTACTHPEIGERMRAAWEEGISDLSGLPQRL